MQLVEADRRAGQPAPVDVAGGQQRERVVDLRRGVVKRPADVELGVVQRPRRQRDVAARRAAADEHDGRAGRRRGDRRVPRLGPADGLHDELVVGRRRAPRRHARRARVACARRSGWRSASVTAQPRRCSSRASMSPIVPPPSTAARTAVCATSPARSTACTAAASGSAIAAPAASRPSGTACSAAAGAAIRSAKPPSTQVIRRHSCVRPAAHCRQAPHGTESPTSTRAPVSSRTPTVSWPKRHG